MPKIKGIYIGIILAATAVIIVGAFALRAMLTHHPLRGQKGKLSQQAITDTTGSAAQYYTDTTHQNFWIGTTNQQALNRQMLIQMLSYADSLGLNPKDYRLNYIITHDSLLRTGHFTDTTRYAATETIFTNTARTFLFSAAYGKAITFSYNGLMYTADTAGIANKLLHLLHHHNWRNTLDSIEPHYYQYTVLKAGYNHIKAIIKQYHTIETTTALNTHGIPVSAILKLKAYGLIGPDVNNDSVYGNNLKPVLQAFQKITGVDTTGHLGSITLNNLKYPLSIRLSEIKASLNFWRWAQRIPEHRLIFVNVGAAVLQVIDSDALKLDMRIIVGERVKEKQTPLFTAYIVNVTTYPHWVVPISIISKEMMPKIARNVCYLQDNNLEVIDYQGNVIDPATISWWKYSASNFPFIIRQTTGCDDALGILKFDPSSPYDIYLHDTNVRDLFGNRYRYLSHGCIRVQKPLELARYILEERFDSTTQSYLNQCMKDQEPHDIKVTKKVPVVIYYLTAAVNPNGTLQFYNDTYSLNIWKRN